MPQDPYRYFRIEVRDLLDQLGKATLELDQGPAPALVAKLLRLAHTLKGAARVVRQTQIADLAHAAEEILSPFRESAESVPRDRVDALLKILDGIAGWVVALDQPKEPAAPTPASEGPQRKDPAPASPSPAKPEEPFRGVHADTSDVDRLLDGLAELHAQVAPLRKCLAMAVRARHLAESLVNRQGLHPGRDGTATAGQPLAEELSSLAGSMERGLVSGIEQLDRELDQVLEAAGRLRLVPVGAVFNALERTARDAAQSLGKRVTFTGLGGDVRLDAKVLSVVQGALVQVVRNAVAHGIESEADRVAARKPVMGRVTVEVARRGRQVVFTGSDDGRGVDLEGVRRIVQAKGFTPAAASEQSPEDLFRLLLKGGISTANTVTAVSGRGVGLDVVRDAVEQLGGEVAVHTGSGTGTRIELTVPLSLTSIEALIVESSAVTAVIPRDAVRRTLLIPLEGITRTVDGESIIHDGKALPFTPLSRILGIGSPRSRGSRPWLTVVVQVGNASAAVGVDRLLGVSNAVIRQLPELAPASAVVAGASLDVEGNPRLVLDPEALIREAGRAVALVQEEKRQQTRILVVDDSLTTRMLERSILESAGYEVEVATSGEEALEKVGHDGAGFRLFLVDVEMPGMDGFTFIERTRADPVLGTIPAILVTSRASPDDRSRGQRVGASAYIVKSEFDQGKILELIQRLVE